jgi:hypothetical protein
MLGNVIPYECVPYRDSLAKYAAAIFRMSLSSVTRFNSTLSLRSSISLQCVLYATLQVGYTFEPIYTAYVGTPLAGQIPQLGDNVAL